MTQYLVSDAAKICGTSSLHTVPVPRCLLADTASRPRSRRLPVPYADETNFEKCSEFFFCFSFKIKKIHHSCLHCQVKMIPVRGRREACAWGFKSIPSSRRACCSCSLSDRLPRCRCCRWRLAPPCWRWRLLWRPLMKGRTGEGAATGGCPSLSLSTDLHHRQSPLNDAQ